MSDQTCATRYPILLVHGTGFRDWKHVGYWGRIPEALREKGAQVYFGGQDGWATVEENAASLARRVDEVLAETGSEKLHLIAHSKGGLDARYLASSLGYGEKLASLTTISTPHHGAKTMDALQRLPRWMFRLAGFFVNAWYRFIGDKNPDFCSVCFQFTTAWAREFNRQNPDAPGVLYRSYAGAMSSCRSDVFMWWQNLIIGWVEGENDGLVTVESARWTGFRQVWRGTGGRGVSHLDEVDFRRRPLGRFAQRNDRDRSLPQSGSDGPSGTVDLTEYYIELVSELRELGM